MMLSFIVGPVAVMVEVSLTKGVTRMARVLHLQKKIMPIIL